MTLNERNFLMQGNELIAEFLGMPKIIGSYEFNKKWDLLMQAVIQIESIDYTVKTERTECTIHGYQYNSVFSSNTSKLHAVFNSVVEFIKFYNEKIKNTTN